MQDASASHGGCVGCLECQDDPVTVAESVQVPSGGWEDPVMVAGWLPTDSFKNRTVVQTCLLYLTVPGPDGPLYRAETDGRES